MRIAELGRAATTLCVLLALSLLHAHLIVGAQDSEQRPPDFPMVQAAQGEVPRIKAFVIIVSQQGFNGTHSSSLVITVNEGDRIQITFIMSEEDRKDTSPHNAHVMEITGYEVHTEEVNPSYPESTITFLADKPGTFTIRCSADYWDCPGHEDLQDGRLEVKGKEEKPPPPKILKTELKLDVVVQCSTECPVSLRAALTDSESRPIAGMPVAFYVNTTFGTLKIGSPYTDSGGLASMKYSAARKGTLGFTALFPGGGGYESSTSIAAIQLPPVEAPPANPLSLSLLTARNVAAGIAAVVTLSLWGTYLYVLGLVRGIARAKKGDSEQTEHSD